MSIEVHLQCQNTDSMTDPVKLEHCLLIERKILENGEMKGGTLRKCPLLEERESNIKRKGMPSRMIVKGKRKQMLETKYFSEPKGCHRFRSDRIYVAESLALSERGLVFYYFGR